MPSIWQDPSLPTRELASHPTVIDAFVPGKRFDIVIAGAGLTGLTSALLLARAGLSVAVVEAREIGAVTTGNTTAKVSLLQGTHLSGILRHTTLKTAKAYVEGNREGQGWLLRYCAEHGIPFQRRDAYTYASTEKGAAAVRHEWRAARRLGLDADLTDAEELPFKTYGSVRLADQAQINPMTVLAALAADLQRHGGVIFETTAVKRVRAGAPTLVETSRGVLLADKVILATGTPILDRGLYFAKLTAQRSYALAYRVPGQVPYGMYISADAPTRSLRTTPIDGEERLLVGGNGHVVGRARSPKALVSDLHEWSQQNFPGAQRTHSWSAQDYEPAGRIPFVGWMPRGRSHIFLATGYDKWGMCSAVAAGLTLSADILGGHVPWAQTLHHRITSPRDVGSFLGANAAVAVELVRGYLGAWSRRMPEGLPGKLRDGEGVIAHEGLRPVGSCMVGSVSSKVSAVCPHLGGVLSWNDEELSWDCPLHGSRFTAQGERLEGPASRNLRVITGD